MERNKKAIVGLLLSSLLAFSVVPSYDVKAQTCDPDALVPVSYGQRGAAVRNAQACLIEAGYDIPAGATGYYGSQTRNAVIEFYADWYGTWSGNNLGPRGVAELKSRLVSAPTQPTQPTQPTTGVTQEQLQQILNLLTQGKTNEALALLLALRAGQSQQPQQPEQPEQPEQTQQSPTEGTLTVERHSEPTSGVPLREGESEYVLGIRFRATQGDVTVQRIRVNWPTNAEAPHRVLSKVELVEAGGNVLWSANVTSAEGQPFYRETDGKYYLLITGLNLNVSKDTVKVVYLRATAVSTYPSGVVGNQITLTVPVQGVRAVTAGGSVNLFEPSSLPVQNNFLLQGTLAGSAALSVVRTSDTPQERNIVANELVSGTGTSAVMRVSQDVPLLKVRLTAQNDNMRLREVVATFNVSNSALEPTLFYLEIDGRKVGNVSVTQSGTVGTTTISDLFPEDITIPAGSSKEAVLGVSRVEGVNYSDRTLTVTLTNVTAENSLNSTGGSFSGSVTSEVVHFFAVAPTFAFPSADNRVTASRDQNLSTTTFSYTGKIGVTLSSNVHAGGQVRISSSSPFALQWEISDGNTAPLTYTIASVRDSAGNVVSQTGGYYVLNAGDTYYFELTAQNSVSGSRQARVRVNYITWEPGNSGSWAGSVTSNYVNRDFVTDWSN